MSNDINMINSFTTAGELIGQVMLGCIVLTRFYCEMENSL
jgi:hypothetical protein